MTAAITVVVRRDYDGRWAASWPPDVVAQGRSAGAGRHHTRTGLIAAIEQAGFVVAATGRDTLDCTPVHA